MLHFPSGHIVIITVDQIAIEREGELSRMEMDAVLLELAFELPAVNELRSAYSFCLVSLNSILL